MPDPTAEVTLGGEVQPSDAQAGQTLSWTFPPGKG
jgi:hypothetical protein